MASGVIITKAAPLPVKNGGCKGLAAKDGLLRGITLAWNISRSDIYKPD